MAEQNQKYSQFRGQPRLPKFAIPKRYDLKLKPDLSACKFSGIVQISVDVVSDTKFLVLNAAELSVNPKSAIFASAKKVVSSLCIDWSEIVFFSVLLFQFGILYRLFENLSQIKFNLIEEEEEGRDDIDFRLFFCSS